MIIVQILAMDCNKLKQYVDNYINANIQYNDTDYNNYYTRHIPNGNILDINKNNR